MKGYAKMITQEEIAKLIKEIEEESDEYTSFLLEQELYIHVLEHIAEKSTGMARKWARLALCYDN